MSQHAAKRFIIAGSSDLFIQSRLKELASLLEYEIIFGVSSQELSDQTLSHPGCIVILDLDSTDYDSSSLARSLKQNKPPPRILGYYPHVRKDVETSAKSAGVDYVVPNSNFLKFTREILEGRPGRP
jgi:DNA-binding NarL/FixJ family response regulator